MRQHKTKQIKITKEICRQNDGVCGIIVFWDSENPNSYHLSHSPGCTGTTRRLPSHSPTLLTTANHFSFWKRRVGCLLDVECALFSRSSFPTIHHRLTWNNWGSRCLDTSRVPSLFSLFLLSSFSSTCVCVWEMIISQYLTNSSLHKGLLLLERVKLNGQVVEFRKRFCWVLLFGHFPSSSGSY